MGVWILLIVLILGIALMVIGGIKQKQEEENADYDAMDLKQLGGSIKKLNKGKMGLVFACRADQENKKQAILQKMAQTAQVEGVNDTVYKISGLVSENYYFKRFSGRDGPYVVYGVYVVDKTKTEIECNDRPEKEDIPDCEKETGQKKLTNKR